MSFNFAAQPEPYHFPPDLFDLVVETIPRLCRTKRDVVLFFRSAGAADCIVSDIEIDLRHSSHCYNKFDMARTMLRRLNEAGDTAIRTRREVLKRIVEFEDFTNCWPQDAMFAEALVARMRHLIDKKDSFTRMRLEREQERQRRLEIEGAKDRARRERLEKIRTIRADLFALFAECDAQKRGSRLENVLNRLFDAYGILVRESFRLRGQAREGVIEQIDGVIELDARVYLVELKWWKKPLGVEEISPHMLRVFGRSNASGIIIADSGFTEPAISQCRQYLSQKTIVLSTLHEIVTILYDEADLVAWLRKKVNAAIVEKNPFLDTVPTVSRAAS